ncbi:MAG: hypothetical protein DRP66_10770 [Planctomycetota bacterium]|nr:MAG: hypothetical protein DRP66_10770 [Planctomycetota bacterium]
MKIKQATAYALHATMYMVRHMTQLPATVKTIARAESIPSKYLAKIFRQLAGAGLIRAASPRGKGYIFARDPEDISILEIFEAIEGGPLFDDCFMRHCQCGGTPENCGIYSAWREAMSKVTDHLAATNLVTAAWDHLPHRFDELPSNA